MALLRRGATAPLPPPPPPPPRRGRRRLACRAFGPDPYGPLERAVGLINRMIAVGERARRAAAAAPPPAAGAPPPPPPPERWVRFSAAAHARVAVDLSAALDGASVAAGGSQEGSPGSESTAAAAAALLGRYLALDPSEYSVLDPAWVSRESPSAFRLRVPLREALGVDLAPALSVEARPDAAGGRVALVGRDAALGAPGLDGRFRVELAATLGAPPARRAPPLPGRPVARLRRWAAGRTARRSAAAAAAAAADSDEDDGGSEAREEEAADGDAEGAEEEHEASSTSIEARSAEDPSEEPAAGRAPLHGRVRVAVAVRVPRALRAVPNPLLGAAGRLVLRAALAAALPAFLDLLAADCLRWAAGGGRRDAAVPLGAGALFPAAVAPAALESAAAPVAAALAGAAEPDANILPAVEPAQAA
jgi:hypothetical protein